MQRDNKTTWGNKQFSIKNLKLLKMRLGVKIKNSRKSGFTIAELMVSITILALIITISSTIYVNFFGSLRNLKAANIVYEESRFVMERIVKEVRNGTIDYEEYFNQNLLKQNLPNYDIIKNESYARDYCQYSRQFYDLGPDNEIGTTDDESMGTRVNQDLITGADVPPAIGKLGNSGVDIPDPIQDDLFLININGDKRSFVKRIEKVDGNNIIGKVGLLKLTGEDFGIDHIKSSDPNLNGDNFSCENDPGENDGRIDTWLCEDGFNCEIIDINGDMSTGCTGKTHNIIYDPSNPEDNSFVDITPTSIDIVDLKFIVDPMDDPRKAYNDNSVQIQPHVTIRLHARANARLSSEFKAGNRPDIILESTVSARAYNEIVTECNLRQCTGLSTKKQCPLTAGVCGPQAQGGDPALQTCDNFVWSGCTEETYTEYANLEYDPNGLYQHGSEFSSCLDDDGCKEDFCTDGYDNDCDGFADSKDTDCQAYLCNNGVNDGIEQEVASPDSCIDVGGACQIYHEYQSEGEENCYDGYDNDCDGNADEFDSDCIAQFCNNGELDPRNGKQFLNSNYTPKNYLLGAGKYDYTTDFDETCIDIGGYCGNGSGSSNSLETVSCNSIDDTTDKLTCVRKVCSDGLDNDCDGNADELDDDCLPIICTNGVQDCSLVPPSYADDDSGNDLSYLVDYVDTDSPSCPSPEFNTDRNDEFAVDIGGICDGYRGVVNENYVDHTKISSENIPHSYDPATLPKHTCNDGLDNDVDGLVDWQDTDCCNDSDGDNFISASDTCQPPQSEQIDCDDTNSNIFPGATEICDGVADDDCDGIPDDKDPDCCIDTDEDSFGTTDSYLSCPGGLPNPPEPDCDELNPNVYPGAPEDTNELCMNEYDATTPINDNCSTLEIDDPASPGTTITVKRANHIDWYADVLPGGISEAFEYKYFEPNCCDISAIEICDDETYGDYGSDENCNGLEGFNDNQCITEDGFTFKDNFGNDNFILSMKNGVIYDEISDIITINLASDTGIITSNTITYLDLESCNSEYNVGISASEIKPSGTDIRYQISNDNGATWCGDNNCTGDWLEAENPNEPYVVNFTNTSNNNLKWRAELSGDGSDNKPSIDSISLIYSCT